MNHGQFARRSENEMYEQLLPTAVIAHTGRVTAVGVLELNGHQDSDIYSEPTVSTATRFVQPASVQLHHPTLNSLAKNQSRMIERRILSGHTDGGAIIQEESLSFNASANDASRRSAIINESIAASVQVDDLDPLFLQQLTSPRRTMSKEEKMLSEDFKPVVAPVPSKYQVSEYKSVYEIGGSSPYCSSENGYKINEYKSDYGV